MLKHDLGGPDDNKAVNANSLAAETEEGRIAERSNVFVIATLYCAAGSAPVRIRNLSPSGALIEGSVLPLPGARVRLLRGSLQASGELVWSADGRAGVRFAGSITVQDWLPGTNLANNQQRVDQVVFTTKCKIRAPVEAPVHAGAGAAVDAAFELGVLANGLARLCEELADDPHVAARFPDNLQAIEATAHRLNRLASAALTAPHDDA
jgi:hypothetical protein